MTPPEEIQKISASTGPGASGLKGCDKDDETDKPKKAIDRYREKYRLVSIRSAILQQENEELTNKLTTVRESIRKARKIRRQILERLDADNDPWRSGSLTREFPATAVKTHQIQSKSMPPVSNSTRSLSPPNIPLPVLSYSSTTTT